MPGSIGDLAPQLHRLACAASTGVLLVQPAVRQARPARIELHEGWVHAIDVEPVIALVGRAPARGEDALRLLLKLPAATSLFEQARAEKRGACTPFHPAAVVRNHVDGAGGDPARLRARAGQSALELVAPPHASCLGHDERPLVAFLLAAPRTLAEIDGAALCPPLRAERLLCFLDAVGALVLRAADSAALFAVLGLTDSATDDEIKRAFRRLARELHPDRHPGASPDERRELERRFAEISAAYRRLV